MFTSIDGGTTIWLVSLAAAAILGAAILLTRFVMRRRMRKNGWSASHDPITIDLTGLAGLSNHLQPKAMMGGRNSVRADKLPLS